MNTRILAACPPAFLSAPAAAPALAGSAAQPGQTIGLPTGAQLPVGLYFEPLTKLPLHRCGQRENSR